VPNTKCGGYEKFIVKGLESMGGISNIVIDREQQLMSVTQDESLREPLIAKLKFMGYPEHDSVTGLTNAKSFVGCAIGRMS
jgi:hypothetical protein